MSCPYDGERLSHFTSQLNVLQSVLHLNQPHLFLRNHGFLASCTQDSNAFTLHYITLDSNAFT